MSIKISEFPVGSALSGTEEIPIVQSATTKKITAQDIADLADSGAVWGEITGDITDQTDLVTALNLKVDAVPGKGLSANDFTDILKTKLDGIEDGAQVNFTNTSDLINDGEDGVNPFITALDIPTAGQAGTLVREVKNMTGATLTKGTVVFISGANGNKPIVTKALAVSDALSSRTFGLLQSNILNNGVGFCVVIGDLSGLDTSAFTEGAQLYLSGTVAGTYTETKTLAPTHLVYVGKVTRSHPTQGQIEVQIQNGYELHEIHDVAISSVANNQALVYESATTLWKNKSLTTDEVADSTNKRYVTDANLVVIGNTSGTNTGDQTFFNPRVQTVSSSATVTAVSTNDIVTITAQAVGLTLANPTGAFVEGQSLIIRIKDNGTARSIAYGTNFRAIGVTAPTTTTANNTLYIGCIYNSTDTKFDIIGVCTGA
jgi:ribosomal protein L35AE/L33A